RSQIVVVGRAKESVAVGEDFKDTFGEDVSLFLALCLEDFENEILLAKAAGARDFQGARDAAKFSNVFFFEFCDGHDHLHEGGMFCGGMRRGKCSRGENGRTIKSSSGANRNCTTSGPMQ